MDAGLHPIPVTLEKIAERDQWLLDFDVLFVPVEKVRSDSSYSLLVLIPKRDQIVNTLGGEHWFVLSGYEPNDQKPLSIDGTYLKQHTDKPGVILLDVLTWAPNYGGKPLVLRSQPRQIPFQRRERGRERKGKASEMTNAPVFNNDSWPSATSSLSVLRLAAAPGWTNLIL